MNLVVKYKENQNDSKVSISAKDYYSIDVFELVNLEDSNVANQLVLNKQTDLFKLSYCDACNLLRPPRSFHCHQCNCCIELHDHHCPWVGTCIGRRNTSYFAAFLTFVSLHATLLTFLVIISPTLHFSNIPIKSNAEFLSICIFGYAGMMSILLGAFSIYVNGLILRNLTHNERIR